MMVRTAAAVVALALALLAWRLDAPATPGTASADGAGATVSEAPVASQPVKQPPHAQANPAMDDWGVVTPPPPRAGRSPSDTQSLDTDAISSLRGTRQGDPRAPDIGEDQRLHEAADRSLRDNYDDYRAWQQQRRLAGYARYVAAANDKLAEMDSQLLWGQSNGVSDAELSAARQKRQRLAQARDQLLTDYPELEIPETDSLTPLAPGANEAASEGQY